MRVLITNISPLRDAALYEELLRYVPAERQEKIARCGKQEDRRRSLGAGLLLEYGLRSLGCSLLPLVPGTETVHLVRGAHGKPELSGGTGVHFNLSHAGDYAAAVFDDGAVGIDVERARRVNVNVMQRQFTAAENAYQTGNRARRQGVRPARLHRKSPRRKPRFEARRAPWSWTVHSKRGCGPDFAAARM